MRKALLVIGEEKISRMRPYVSFLRFINLAQRLRSKANFELKIISYDQLLSGKVPRVDSSRIFVVFFFPYRYWNRHIETYHDDRIYGDQTFGREFKTFFARVKRAIEKFYGGKRIEYLSRPEVCYLDRDKQATKVVLRRNKVSTPRAFRVSSLDDVQRLLNQGTSLYIKPRFGAMGKGITYIDKEQLISNFLFRKGKVVSRPYDFNWRFTRIKDKESFINRLLKKGFICEEAITPAIIRRRRFDFRVYVMFGKVVYLYAKSSPAQSWVTNWSQGGRIDKRKTILNTLPPEKITHLKKLAKKAAEALGVKFAGIDIIFSRDMNSAYVLEGNIFPGYEKGFDLMKCLLNSLLGTVPHNHM